MLLSESDIARSQIHSQIQKSLQWQKDWNAQGDPKGWRLCWIQGFHGPKGSGKGPSQVKNTVIVCRLPKDLRGESPRLVLFGIVRRVLLSPFSRHFFFSPQTSDVLPALLLFALSPPTEVTFEGERGGERSKLAARLWFILRGVFSGVVDVFDLGELGQGPRSPPSPLPCP